MTHTPRLALGHISPGQMQKEIAHNSALERIDMAVQPVVEGSSVSAPPSGAVVGECYLVSSTATGAWEGHDGALAMLGDGGWIFLDPFEGLAVFDRSSGSLVRYVGGSWSAEILRGALLDANGSQVVGDRQASVAIPSGGSTKDTQARTAISEILDRLLAHGLISS